MESKGEGGSCKQFSAYDKFDMVFDYLFMICLDFLVEKQILLSKQTEYFNLTHITKVWDQCSLLIKMHVCTQDALINCLNRSM